MIPFVLLCILLIAGCGRDSRQPAERPSAARTEGRPQSGGTLLLPVEPLRLSLHPLQGRNSFQPQLWDGLHPALLRPLPNGARSQIVRGDLARAWDWNEEERTLTLRLRGDRLWDDTTRVNARDVVASYEAYLDAGYFGSVLPAGGTRAKPLPARGGALLLRVEALDDSLVRFVFRGDVAAWRAYEACSHPILSADWLDDRQKGKGSSLSRPLPSAGAFRIPQNLTGKNLIFRANPLLPYVTRPWVRRVLFEPCPGVDSRVIRLAAGRADYVADVPIFHLVNWVPAEAQVAAHARGVASIEMLWFRWDDPLFTPAFREAISLAIDRDRLVSSLLSWRGHSYGGPAGGVLEPRVHALAPIDSTKMAPAEPAVFGPSLPETLSVEARLDSLLRANPAPTHDVARAQALLDQLGFVDGDGDGLRGRALFAGDSSSVIETPIRIRVLYDRSNELRERMLTYLEEDLFTIGLLLEPEPVDSDHFFSRFESGLFQAALLGFRPPEAPDLSPLWASWGRWNGGDYASLTVDGLIRTALSTSDDARLEQLNREIEARVRRDRPVAFLVYREEVDLVSPRVRGAAETRGDLLGRLSRVWLADTTDVPSLSEVLADSSRAFAR
ncbi:MAG: hypothetical protein IT349_04315 [Candidatus Eisenbacteria bacterium]|nr:hypothetical protein [Candidatus Eisenbacteria bacterium]